MEGGDGSVAPEAVVVKKEPSWETSAGSCGVSSAGARAGLYCRELKHEAAPEPGGTDGQVSVKEEAENVKEECGLSAAQALLYAGHEVRGELVLGPEGLQPQDAAFTLRAAAQRVSWADGRQQELTSCDRPGEALALRECRVTLERLVIPEPCLEKKSNAEIKHSNSCVVSAAAQRVSWVDGRQQQLTSCDRPGEALALRECRVTLERLVIPEPCLEKKSNAEIKHSNSKVTLVSVDRGHELEAVPHSSELSPGRDVTDPAARREARAADSDTQPEPVLDRKIRSSMHAWSGPKQNEPQLTVKPCDNPRKPMLKISIKRTMQPSPTGDLWDNKRLKPVEADKHTIIHTASNGETSTGQKTRPDLLHENKPVGMPLQSTLSELPCEKPPSPVAQDPKRALSMPVLDVIESNDVDGDQEVQLTEERPSFHPGHPSRETDVGISAEGTHNNERPPSQCLMTTPSTSHHVPNLLRVSSQLFEPTSRKQSSSGIKNAVVKKTRLEQITRYISAAARHSSNPSMRSSCSVCTQSSYNHLQVSRRPVNHARCHIGENVIDQRLLLQGTINNTSAAQNLSKLAYQSRFLVEESHQRQHLPTQEDYLQQIARIQGVLRRPDIVPVTDQRGYIQHSMMNGGFVRQNPANSINQHSQFLPRPENQSVPIDKHHMQQILRLQLLGGSTEGTHTVLNVNSQNVGINIPFTAQGSSYVPNQSHHNVELLQQRQNLPNYQDPQRDLPTSKVQFDPYFNSKSNSQRPQISSPSVLVNISNPTTQSNRHENYLLRDPRIQVTLNQSSTEHHSNLTTVPQNITVEPVTMQDFEVQTTSSGPSHETQFTLDPHIPVYQEPRTKKLMVDQSTTTDFNMDHDHGNGTFRSPVIEMSSRLVDSECQTDINLVEEPLSPSQEVASDHEAITDHEIVSDQEEISDQAGVSDNEMSTDVPPLDINNTVICTEENPPQNNTEERPTTVQNCTPEYQQAHPKVVTEQKMLNIFATLFIQMGAHMSYTTEMFNNFRTSILESAKTYQLLLETVESLNSMGNFQIDVSPSNIVTAEVPQLTEERPAGESERANSVNGEENTNNDSGDKPEKTRLRHTFILPPEYDPNDSKWTLKYKKAEPGLVELMPRSGIYVRSSELKRCKKKSKDCKMFARQLLTEIFNKSALSVCSWTGGKAKAFNNVDIDVRPGLDAHARMVMLTYVEEHSLKRKWYMSDPQSIIGSIRSKIQEIRAKHGKSITC